LIRQKRWSLSLPEATSRTVVLTMESPCSIEFRTARCSKVENRTWFRSRT
jgi:hypothetical protein